MDEHGFQIILGFLSVVGSALASYWTSRIAVAVAIAVLTQRVQDNADEILRMRKAQHDLRDKMPENIERIVRILFDRD